MYRALARKLKLMTFSQNWEISVYQKTPPWLATNFFCYNLQNSGKHDSGKEIFQSMALYNTYKSPLRNAICLCLS